MTQHNIKIGARILPFTGFEEAADVRPEPEGGKEISRNVAAEKLRTA